MSCKDSWDNNSFKMEWKDYLYGFQCVAKLILERQNLLKNAKSKYDHNVHLETLNTSLTPKFMEYFKGVFAVVRNYPLGAYHDTFSFKEYAEIKEIYDKAINALDNAGYKIIVNSIPSSVN